MDIDKLIKALDKEENEEILNMTSEKINQMVQQALDELLLTDDTYDTYISKLQGYRYIDEIDDLKIGSFIRWILLKNPDNLRLTNGSILCDIKITDIGIVLVCKGAYGKYFQVKFDENMIFQKLSDQERVLLSALDHLSYDN